MSCRLALLALPCLIYTRPVLGGRSGCRGAAARGAPVLMGFGRGREGGAFRALFAVLACWPSRARRLSHFQRSKYHLGSRPEQQTGSIFRKQVASRLQVAKISPRCVCSLKRGWSTPEPKQSEMEVITDKAALEVITDKSALKVITDKGRGVSRTPHQRGAAGGGRQTWHGHGHQTCSGPRYR